MFEILCKIHGVKAGSKEEKKISQRVNELIFNTNMEPEQILIKLIKKTFESKPA